MNSSKKTVLRTFRLTQELDSVVQEEAQARGVSVNTLINQIMKKFSEWDRHIEKFGFVSVSCEVFRTIAAEVEDAKLETIIGTLGSRVPEALTLYCFKKVSLDAALRMISLSLSLWKV
jgi:hypothetical protein